MVEPLPLTSTFLSNKELSALIKAELFARVTPQLKGLGFQVVGRARRGKLPFRYWRERDGRIDMLEFQWDKYNRPRFIINFRPVDDERDIARLKANPGAEWDNLYSGYYRASAGGGLGERWFRPSLPARLFYPRPAIHRLVAQVERRVIEVDRFLGGGEPSRFIRYVGHPRPSENWPDDFFARPPALLKARRGRSAAPRLRPDASHK